MVTQKTEYGQTKEESLGSLWKMDVFIYIVARPAGRILDGRSLADLNNLICWDWSIAASVSAVSAAKNDCASSAVAEAMKTMMAFLTLGLWIIDRMAP